MTENSRQEEYFQLIDRLLRCSNGKEPEVLNESADLIDEDFVRTTLEVATFMSHENNQEGAKFLFFIARQLAKQLNLYPDVATASESQQ